MSLAYRALAPLRLAAKGAAFVFGGLNSFLSQWGNWGQGSWYQTDPRLGGTEYNYRQAVGDGRGSAIIMSVVSWLCRTFPEASLTVDAEGDGGDAAAIPRHPMVRLIERPNPYYSGILLWMATLADWVLTGNAYWIKVRNGVGRPIQLYWAPARLIEPRWPSDGTVYVSHYEYRPFGQPIALRPEDVVHFRYGIDPENVRKGMSLVATLLREIFTDDEAANYTASILKNLGVVGTVLAPSGQDVAVSKDSAERIKAEFRQKFGGDNRGDVMVMSQPVSVTSVAFNPKDMSLKDIRRIPEERVTAIFGIPAVVVGMGAGLDRSCVPAEARVMTPDGPRTVAQIGAGDIVWSFKDGRIVPRAVTHKWRTSRPDMVYEVRTSRGSLRATGNHPVMVRVPGTSGNGNQDRHATYAWRHVELLQPGDCVVRAMAYPDVGGDQTPDGMPAAPELLRFLGALIGDGTVRPGVGVRVAMPPEDRCAAHYQGLAGSLFTKLARNAGGSVEQHAALPRAPIALQVRDRDFGFSSAEASRRLGAWGFDGRAHTKRVPGWVYGLRRDLRLQFLAGIVDTDGSVDKRGVLAVAFCHRALTDDVRDLATSCGFACSSVLRSVTLASRLPNPGRAESYESWGFVVSSARDVAEIPFADFLYRERVGANPNRHRPRGKDAAKAGLSSDLGFFVVRGIVPVGVQPVYDLTVEDGHSFFCEHVLVSNTFSNFAEARIAAYESNVFPTQRLFAAELQTQLLPDFADPDLQTVGWDYSEVRALQDDKNSLYERLSKGVLAGWVKPNEARVQAGMDEQPAGDCFYVPNVVTAIPVDHVTELAPPPVAVPPPALQAVPGPDRPPAASADAA